MKDTIKFTHAAIDHHEPNVSASHTNKTKIILYRIHVMTTVIKVFVLHSL
ncbi:hypothetical protein [Bacteroides acidifaciens]|nr:hypothetical protein [Bacteroides acidifaciens]